MNTRVRLVLLLRRLLATAGAIICWMVLVAGAVFLINGLGHIAGLGKEVTVHVLTAGSRRRASLGYYLDGGREITVSTGSNYRPGELIQARLPLLHLPGVDDGRVLRGGGPTLMRVFGGVVGLFVGIIGGTALTYYAIQARGLRSTGRFFLPTADDIAYVVGCVGVAIFFGLGLWPGMSGGQSDAAAVIAIACAVVVLLRRSVALHARRTPTSSPLPRQRR